MSFETGDSNGSGNKGESPRVEIDTSAPFDSVKEAVRRFGGVGYWKPSSRQNQLALTQNGMGEADLAQVEEQASLLEKDLMVEERETLDVLKELEATKNLVEDLKAKLQKQTYENLDTGAEDGNLSPALEEEMKKDNQENVQIDCHLGKDLSSSLSSAPGLILMELKQAKLNLLRTTDDLAGIRASVESLNKKLGKERVSLEKTRERLSLNSSKIASLEEELSLTKQKLEWAKETGVNDSADGPLEITRELQQLGHETEQFKKMGEVAKSVVSRAVSEIEQTKTRIKTAEISLVAARKMKEAARAAEYVALAEIKALSSHESSSADSLPKPSEGVTLPYEEYVTLTCKARETEELYKAKIKDAMGLDYEANVSNTEILKRVEEATEEVKTGKKAFEEALNRVEAANREKLAVEGALRMWRSDNGQRRRSIHNSTNFKNSFSSQQRRDSFLRDVNGLDSENYGSMPVLKPTLSIGQILSRKLLVSEDFETGMPTGKGTAKRKVSLGQMLSKRKGDTPGNRKPDKENCNKQFSGKRKKFGLARLSLLLVKQSKKKKPPTPDHR